LNPLLFHLLQRNEGGTIRFCASHCFSIGRQKGAEAGEKGATYWKAEIRLSPG
jgi:hypothetical protein